MNAFWGLLTLLTVPLTILNVLGGICSVIWLAILGDWGAIGYGLLAIMGSIYVISLACMPLLATGLAGEYFADKGRIFLCYIVVALSSLYIVMIMTVWCGSVLYFFVARATSESFIPLLIWSYVVALTPWQWMVQKEIQNGDKAADGLVSGGVTFFAQIGYVVMVLMAYFGTPTMVDMSIFFFVIVLIGNTLYAMKTGLFTFSKTSDQTSSGIT
ncbi:hypothetical protein [Candidatus Nitrospira salsa]